MVLSLEKLINKKIYNMYNELIDFGFAITTNTIIIN